MIGDNFFFLNSVESTNNYAMARAHAGLAQHGDAYFAWEQTAGKGQRGKSWKAAPGENITMSLFLNTEEMMASGQFLLSASIALACLNLLTKKIGDDVKIKWPNDLYWRDRKAGGILIENQLAGTEWRWSVVGIGLNINQTNFEDLQKAVSLKQITGKNWEPEQLARELCTLVEDYWQNLIQNNPANLMEAYNQSLYKKDEQVRLKKNNIGFHAKIKEVTPEGLLITENGMSNAFSSGEIQWVI